MLRLSQLRNWTSGCDFWVRGGPRGVRGGSEGEARTESRKSVGAFCLTFALRVVHAKAKNAHKS